MLIKAVVEGREGFLIFDTGAPFLILNEFYFDDKKSRSTNRTAVDYNGHLKSVKARTTSLTIGTLQRNNEHASVTDLQHLKVAQDFPLLGLAGTQLFDQYEMIFDFLRSEILLFELDRSGNIEDLSYSGNEPDIVLPLGLKGHVPYFEISVGDTKLKMGLDTGAEIALIHPKHKKALQNHLMPYGAINIIGVSKTRGHGKLSRLFNVKCSFLLFKAICVTFSDFSDFNAKVPGIELDGILGTEFLCQFLMAVNTQKKELHIWLSEKQEVLVVNDIKNNSK